MSIDELRVKDAANLSGDERAFLEAHKSELSTDEQAKFGLTATAAKADELSAEDKALLAAIKSGDKMVVDKGASAVDAERLSALEATAKKYETEKAEGIVEAHVKRGAIKQDQADFWTKQLLSAANDEHRQEMETALAGLPSNEQIGKENGSGEDVA